MPNFQTHYTFVIEVKGDEAIQQAQQIGTAIGSALKQTQQTTGVATFTALTKAMQDNIVTSQQVAKALDRMTQTIAKTQTGAQKLGQSLTNNVARGLDRVAESAKGAETKLLATTVAANNLRLAQSNQPQLPGFGAQQPMLPGFQGVLDNRLPGVGGLLGAFPGSSSGGGDIGKTFTDAINDATRQIWGLRRLGYEIETIGRGIQTTAKGWADSLLTAADAYLALDAAAGRAEIALRIQDDLMGDLRKGILDMSVEMALLKPDELADGVRLWAEGTNIQVQSQEDLNKVMTTAADIQRLVVLNNGDLGSTTEAVGAAMNEFGLSMDDVTQITETMNFVTQTTFASLDDIGNAFKLVGPLAAQVGDDITTVATAIGIMADNNIKGTMAGRALRQLYRGLTKDTESNNKAMNTALGLSEDMGDAWRTLIFPGGEFVGLDQFMTELVIATENQTKAQTAQTLSLIATANELPALISLLDQQREARERGFNFIRASSKETIGLVDDEVLALRRFQEEQSGIAAGAETATEMINRQWAELEEKDSFRAERMQRRWEKTFISIGENATKFVLPILEAFSENTVFLTDIIERVPAFTQLAVIFTSVAASAGLFVTSLGLAVRWGTNLYALFRGISKTLPLISAKIGGLLPGVLTGFGGVGAAGAAGLGVTGMAGAATAEFLPDLVRTFAQGWIDFFFPEFGKSLTAAFQNKPFLRAGIKLATPGQGIFGIEPSVFADIKEGFVDMFTLQENQREFAAEQSANIREMTRQQERLMRQAAASTFVRGALQERGELQKEEARIDALRELADEGIAIAKDADEQIQNIRDRNTRADLEALRDRLLMYQEAGERRAEIEADTQQKILELNIATQQRIVDTIQSHQEAIARASRDFALREGRTQADAARRRAKDNAEFMRREAEIATDLLDSRQDATEDFQRDEADAARDHHLAMQRLERDHRDNLIDLLESRDVQGIVKEMRAFRRRRQDAEEDFRQGSGDRKSDFDRRRAEEEEDIEKNRQSRLEGLQRRQKDEDEAAALSASRRQEDFDRAASDRQIAFEASLVRITTDAAETLAKINQTREDNLEALEQYLADENDIRRIAEINRGLDAERAIAKELRDKATALKAFAIMAGIKIAIINEVDAAEEAAWLAQTRRQGEVQAQGGLPAQRRANEGQWPGYGPPVYPDPAMWIGPLPLPQPWIPSQQPFPQRPVPQYQSGGYTSSGLSQMHDDEFVLNANTTSFLERRFGRLDQGVFTSGQGLGGDGVTINMPMTFHGTRRQDANFMRKAMRKEAAFVLNSMAQKSRGNNAYPV